MDEMVKTQRQHSGFTLRTKGVNRSFTTDAHLLERLGRDKDNKHE